MLILYPTIFIHFLYDFTCSDVVVSIGGPKSKESNPPGSFHSNSGGGPNLRKICSRAIYGALRDLSTWPSKHAINSATVTSYKHFFAATATWSNSIMVETYDFCHVFIIFITARHTPSRSPTAHR